MHWARALLLLAVVVGTVSAAAEFDTHRMRLLVDELVGLGLFDDTVKAQASVSCVEMTVEECYAETNLAYTTHYETLIVRSFVHKLKELLDGYNAAVRSYVDKVLAPADPSTPLTDEQLQTVAFHGSGAYCVIGLADMHAASGFGEQLADYVFYDRLASVAGVRENLIFVKLVGDYLTWRGLAAGAPGAPGGDPAAAVAAAKQKIDDYTRPFCDLQAKYGVQWMPAVTLMYSRLNVAAPLFRDQIDGHLVFDQTGLAEEGNQTLQSVIDVYSDFTKYGEASAFHDKVDTLVEGYVFKVLFNKMLRLTIRALESFHEYKKSLAPGEDLKNVVHDLRFNQQNFFGSVLTSFRGLLCYYMSVPPVITDNDLIGYVVDELSDVLTGFKEFTDTEDLKKTPGLSIARLRKLLNDSQFRLAVESTSGEQINSIEDCIKAGERVNNALAYLTEAKNID